MFLIVSINLMFTLTSNMCHQHIGSSFIILNTSIGTMDQLIMLQNIFLLLWSIGGDRSERKMRSYKCQI